MQLPSTVFSQINSALYPAEFSRCTELFPNQRPTRGLTSYDQFLALTFGQLTYRESLRDIVACLKARGPLLYHLGFVQKQSWYFKATCSHNICHF